MINNNCSHVLELFINLRATIQKLSCFSRSGAVGCHSIGEIYLKQVLKKMQIQRRKRLYLDFQAMPEVINYVYSKNSLGLMTDIESKPSGSRKCSELEGNVTVNQENYSNQSQMCEFAVIKRGAQYYSGKKILIYGEEFCASTMVKQITFWS